MDDRRYMLEAIELAKNGLGWVSPNPPVGCVIVSADGKICGRGWHERYGEAHAEVNALLQAGPSAAGATAYVTLMPCNHQGKTPPCTEALIAAGISRVVVSLDDPDPVSGAGRERMQEAGIEVEIGLLADLTLKIMHGFVKFVKTGLPHITLKYAMTMDGCIATAVGDSKWISADDSREYVQTLRSQADAVLVGSGTMLADNPRLNVRDFSKAQPFRVILDSRLQTLDTAEVFGCGGGKVIIIGSEKVEKSRISALQLAGAEVLLVAEQGGYLDLELALSELGKRYGVRSILCEGGGGLAGALIRAGLVDRILTFIAPKILGGTGIQPTLGVASELMQDAEVLQDFESTMLATDVLCSGWFARSLEL